MSGLLPKIRRPQRCGGWVALGQEEPVGGASVQEAGGERVLGREAVFGQQRSCTAGGGDVRDEAAMGLARTDEIAAAVQVEECSFRTRALRIKPFSRHSKRVDRRRLHRRGHWEQRAPLIQSSALVHDGTVEGKTLVALAKIEFEELSANARHRGCRVVPSD